MPAAKDFIDFVDEVSQDTGDPVSMVEDYDEVDWDVDVWDLDQGSFVKRAAKGIAQRTFKRPQQSINKLVTLNLSLVISIIFYRYPIPPLKSLTQQGRKTRDKATYTFGVLNIAVTSFLVSYPHWLAFWYTFKAVSLISLRFVLYRREKAHYFLLDFCYFANLLHLLYLWVFPNSATLYMICFVFSNGPLAIAIIAWRNSMVLHSLDKMTSIFIHLSPPLITFSLRWVGHDGFAICPNEECSITFAQIFLYCISGYMVWQVLYYVKVELASREKVAQQGYVTSRNYMQGKKGSMQYKLVQKYGERYATLIFMAIQLLYTFLFDYVWLHVAYLLSISMLCAWNGGNFYMEVFAARYLPELSSKYQDDENAEEEHED